MEVARRQARHTNHHVSGLVISEQPYPGFFDDRKAFIAIVVDDKDRDPGDLRWHCTGSGKRSAEIGKNLARLSCKIAL
jgi:hypothetical protein